MRPRFLASVLLLLLLPSLAFAQATSVDTLTPPFSSEGARKAADLISWGTVLTSLALDARAAYQDPNDRAHALELFGARTFVTFGVATIVKGVAERQRPCAHLPEGCGHDAPDTSFYSLHTAFACQAIGRSGNGGAAVGFNIAVPLGLGTGFLRLGAGKHWLTDVSAGCAAGIFAGVAIR